MMVGVFCESRAISTDSESYVVAFDGQLNLHETWTTTERKSDFPAIQVRAKGP